jgi:GPCR proteolysis site, GPS, motif
VVRDCQFSSSVTGKGGAVYVGDGSTVRMHSVTLTRSYQSHFGGLLYSAGAYVLVESSTIAMAASLNEGGCIMASAGTIELRDTVVGNCSSVLGAAMMAGDPLATNTVNAIVDGGVIERSSALSGGGAVYVRALATLKILGGAEVRDCESTVFGGGISAKGNVDLVDVSLRRCKTLSADQNDGGGGAIFMASGTVLTAQSCTFENNSAPDWCGGAVSVSTSSPGGSVANFSQCVMSGNTAKAENAAPMSPDGDFSSGRGGAIFVGSALAQPFDAFVTLDGCVLTLNAADVAGGALFADATHLHIANTLLTQNSAGAFGGALALAAPTAGTRSLATRHVHVSGATTTFLSNWAQSAYLVSAGGAIYVDDGSAHLRGAVFQSNSAGADIGIGWAPEASHGGDIAGVDVDVDIGGCSFESSSANRGGSLHLDVPANRNASIELLVTSSLFSGVTSRQGAAAVHVRASSHNVILDGVSIVSCVSHESAAALRLEPDNVSAVPTSSALFTDVRDSHFSANRGSMLMHIETNAVRVSSSIVSETCELDNVTPTDVESLFARNGVLARYDAVDTQVTLCGGAEPCLGLATRQLNFECAPVGTAAPQCTLCDCPLSSTADCTGSPFDANACECVCPSIASGERCEQCASSHDCGVNAALQGAPPSCFCQCTEPWTTVGTAVCTQLSCGSTCTECALTTDDECANGGIVLAAPLCGCLCVSPAFGGVDCSQCVATDADCELALLDVEARFEVSAASFLIGPLPTSALLPDGGVDLCAHLFAPATLALLGDAAGRRCEATSPTSARVVFGLHALAQVDTPLALGFGTTVPRVVVLDVPPNGAAWTLSVAISVEGPRRFAACDASAVVYSAAASVDSAGRPPVAYEWSLRVAGDSAPPLATSTEPALSLAPAATALSAGTAYTLSVSARTFVGTSAQRQIALTVVDDGELGAPGTVTLVDDASTRTVYVSEAFVLAVDVVPSACNSALPPPLDDDELVVGPPPVWRIGALDLVGSAVIVPANALPAGEHLARFQFGLDDATALASVSITVLPDVPLAVISGGAERSLSLRADSVAFDGSRSRGAARFRWRLSRDQALLASFEGSAAEGAAQWLVEDASLFDVPGFYVLELVVEADGHPLQTVDESEPTFVRIEVMTSEVPFASLDLSVIDHINVGNGFSVRGICCYRTVPRWHVNADVAAMIGVPPLGGYDTYTIAFPATHSAGVADGTRYSFEFTCTDGDSVGYARAMLIVKAPPFAQLGSCSLTLPIGQASVMAVSDKVALRCTGFAPPSYYFVDVDGRLFNSVPLATLARGLLLSLPANDVEFDEAHQVDVVVRVCDGLLASAASCLVVHVASVTVDSLQLSTEEDEQQAKLALFGRTLLELFSLGRVDDAIALIVQLSSALNKDPEARADAAAVAASIILLLDDTNGAIGLSAETLPPEIVVHLARMFTSVLETFRVAPDSAAAAVSAIANVDADDRLPEIFNSIFARLASEGMPPLPLSQDALFAFLTMASDMAMLDGVVDPSVVALLANLAVLGQPCGLPPAAPMQLPAFTISVRRSYGSTDGESLDVASAQVPPGLFGATPPWQCVDQYAIAFKEGINPFAVGSLSSGVLDFTLGLSDADPINEAPDTAEFAKQLSEPIVFTFVRADGSDEPTCAFFDEATGRWSTDGVRLVSIVDNVVTCEADHLSNFALLLSSGADGEGCCTTVQWLSIGFFVGFFVLCAVLAIVVTRMPRKGRLYRCMFGREGARVQKSRQAVRQYKDRRASGAGVSTDASSTSANDSSSPHAESERERVRKERRLERVDRKRSAFGAELRTDID